VNWFLICLKDTREQPIASSVKAGCYGNRFNIYPWAVGKIADGETLVSREQVYSITESIWEVTRLEGCTDCCSPLAELFDIIPTRFAI
jgi:hypothetical protein